MAAGTPEELQGMGRSETFGGNGNLNKNKAIFTNYPCFC